MVDQNSDATGKATEMTTKVLRQSGPAFEEFRAMFKDCSDSFDRGDDEAGRQTLVNEVIPQLREFAGFCASLLDSTGDVSAALRGEFVAKCESFEEILTTLVEELEGQNLTEVGDILRFDLVDLMMAFSALFPKLADDLQGRG